MTAITLDSGNVVRPLVVFDVDCTIGCGHDAPCCEPRPGITILCAVLYVLGYELRMWSAGGAEHAESWGKASRLSAVMSGYHTKPDYPIAPEAVRELFGRLPVLTMDDDETEAIEGVTFIPVEPYCCHQERLTDGGEGEAAPLGSVCVVADLCHRSFALLRRGRRRRPRPPRLGQVHRVRGRRSRADLAGRVLGGVDRGRRRDRRGQRLMAIVLPLDSTDLNPNER